MTKIRIKITPKPTKDKDNPGFKPVHKRWVIERSNAWSEKCRLLWKNCEKFIETSVAKLQLCTIRLQIKRLARGQISNGFYRIHTDSVQRNLIPATISTKQAHITYASEADVLNKALYGLTAKEWREQNPDKEGNIRDGTRRNKKIILLYFL